MTHSIFHFNRNDAEEAINKLNGTVIGKQKVRLSWGRSLNNKQQVNPKFPIYMAFEFFTVLILYTNMNLT